jgi:hypothetical protein
MKKTEYFALTGETIEREMTAEEILDIQTRTLAYEETKAAEAQAKAQAKAELLERLGITADEAKLLLA